MASECYLWLMPSKSLMLVLATLLAMLAAPRDAHAQEAATLDRAAWLAGCWEHRAGARVTTEIWMPASGGLMLGAGRTVVGGQARQYEQLRLTVEGGRLVYTALPSGQKETAFTSAATLSPRTDSLVFENLAHDFPQRITYWRVGTDSLVARVEGAGPTGAMRGFDQPMRRVRCESPD